MQYVSFSAPIIELDMIFTFLSIALLEMFDLSGRFFVVLCNMLKNTSGELDVHSGKDAKVPLMRFKFEGISVDLPYAQLQVTSVPEKCGTSPHR